MHTVYIFSQSQAIVAHISFWSSDEVRALIVWVKNKIKKAIGFEFVNSF